MHAYTESHALIHRQHRITHTCQPMCLFIAVLSFPTFSPPASSHNSAFVIMNDVSPSNCSCPQVFPSLDVGYPSLKFEKNILPISHVCDFIKCNHQVIKRISSPQREMAFSFSWYYQHLYKWPLTVVCDMVLEIVSSGHRSWTPGPQALGEAPSCKKRSVRWLCVNVATPAKALLGAAGLWSVFNHRQCLCMWKETSKSTRLR